MRDYFHILFRLRNFNTQNTVLHTALAASAKSVQWVRKRTPLVGMIYGTDEVYSL